ncbi:Aldehyde dehydrogenase C-terminal [Penicillium sp. IBT 16267x]|nr:Aldehyde dehydrogenase C-terminal [Penicillium sp. IBT 16267x]
MPFKNPFSRTKRPTRAKEKHASQLEQNPASNSNVVSSPLSSNDFQTTSHDSQTNSTPPISGTGQRNLWYEAFDKLPQNYKKELGNRGMNQQIANPIEEFRKEARKVRDRSQEMEWKVQIGSHELPFRQTAVQILDWANKIGDIAIYFKGLDTFDTEKSALLSVVDKVAEAIFCGELYYGIYTLEKTGKVDVVTKLHDALVDLYSCVLELLVKSLDLSSNTAVHFCQAIFDPQKPSQMLANLEAKKKTLQAAAERCEITAHAVSDETWKIYLQTAQNSLDQVIQWINEEDRRELLEWVSKVRYDRHHEQIEEHRSPETGHWLFQHKKFRTWMDSSSPSVLWLQGSPGTGKTFLTSGVVKNPIDNTESRMHGLAFFFCNHAEKDRREALPVLRSLVRQLAAPKSNTHAARRGLREARKRATDNGSDLGLSECRHQLLDSFNSYSETIVILDALDELDNEELVSLVKELNNIISKTRDRLGVKIFVSSRPIQEIGLAFSSSPTVTIQATDNRNDIEKSLIMELDIFEKGHPNSVINSRKKEIMKIFLEKCDNIFLVAALQIKQILKCQMNESIDLALEELPKDLNESYVRIYQKIQSRPSPEIEMANRTFKWIMCAPDPLTSGQLLSAVRMYIENDDIKLKDPIEQDTLLSICGNFLIIDSNGQWRFFHLSVLEHLQKLPEFKNRQERLHLHFSLYEIFSQCREKSNFNPFQLNENGNDLLQIAGSTDCVPILRALISKLVSIDNTSVDKAHSAAFSGAASSGSLNALKYLVDEAGADVNLPLQVGYHGSALAGASWSLNLDTVRFLVERGADLNLPLQAGYFGSALAAASFRNNNMDIVRYLVERGADVNLPLQAGDFGSALAAASFSNNNLDTVKYLVEQGADVDLPLLAGDFGSAIDASLFRGNSEVVEYLRSKQATALIEDSEFNEDLMLTLYVKRFPDSKFNNQGPALPSSRDCI